MVQFSKFFSSALLAGALLLPATARGADKLYLDFQPTDEIIVNPERGLFHHLEFHTDDNNAITSSYLQHIRQADGMSLVFTVYVMKEFRNGSDISRAYLDRIRSNMDVIRREGFKTILRFCYSYGQNDYPRDVPWYVCSRHIEQLKPILQEYSDVIAVLEAGFIGAWGEWYYTDNYGMNPFKFEEYAPRKDVLLTLLDAMPETRFVSVRYPAAKLGIFRLGTPQTINLSTAYNGSDISRTGFHNDCFLGDADDVGTFGYNQHYRQYWKTETQYVPMGGETCADPNDYTEQFNAQQAFADYHWSYLNKDYHPAVISQWNNNYFLETIRRNLGYRLQLIEGECDKSINPGSDWNLKFKIRNVGWAAPFNPRNVEIVFVPTGQASARYVYKVDADPRYWFAGTTNEVEAKIPIPYDMAAGSYTVYLNLPDPCETLHDDSRYSIRLANRGIWNEATGYNQLLTIDIEEATGLHSQKVDDSAAVTVCDTSGRIIRRKVPRPHALDHLPQGIYLIDGEKIYKR